MTLPSIASDSIKAKGKSRTSSIAHVPIRMIWAQRILGYISPSNTSNQQSWRTDLEAMRYTHQNLAPMHMAHLYTAQPAAYKNGILNVKTIVIKKN